MDFKLPVSLDLIILLVIIPPYMDDLGQAFLLSIALLLYIVIELYYPLSSFKTLPESFDKARLAFLMRLLLLFVIVFAAGILPTLEGVYLRLLTEVDENGFSPAYEVLHDGALQMEIAVDAFLDGENPYSIQYDQTPMQFYKIGGVDYPPSENPFFYYFPYLPGYLWLSAPIYQLATQLGLFYDQRFVYLLFYLLFIFLLPLFAKAPVHKLLLISMVGLNFWVVGPVTIGQNDIVAIFFVTLTCLLTIKKKLLWAALFLGLACTIKQSAWFFVPFYASLVWQMIPADERKSTIIKMIGVMAIFPIMFLIPFFLWDPNAFLTDVFSYPAGNVPYNYPIRGYTLGVFLVGFGVIEDPLDSFPFWVFQLVLGVPLLLILLRYQWRRNNMGIMLICVGLFTFAFGFLSRFFQGNYLGYVLALFSLGILLEPVTHKLFTEDTSQ